MGCGMGMVKTLLFIFNFIFAVCGLGILVIGVIIHLDLHDVTEHVGTNVMFPTITFMVVGSIIFVVSFFGCCGAIRSSHCMIITFASMLLLILLIQVAVAVYAFVVIKNANPSDITTGYDQLFQTYPVDEKNREVVDIVQRVFSCCGVVSKSDYNAHGNFTGTIPWSCCNDKKEGETCEAGDAYDVGCVPKLKDALIKAGNILGGVAIGIAGVELIGIIFALCLANSIKNAERRGYRV